MPITPLHGASEPNPHYEALGIGPGATATPAPTYSPFGGVGAGTFQLDAAGGLTNGSASMVMPAAAVWSLMHREANVRAREDDLRRREWEWLRGYAIAGIVGAALVAVIGALAWMGLRPRDIRA